MLFPTLIAFASLITVLHVLPMAIVSAAVGAGPTVVRLFLGPKLFQFHFRTVLVEIGCLPFGGHISFGEERGEDGLSQVHPLARAAIAASGCAVLFVLGLLLGGQLSTFSKGFLQIPLGAVQPEAVGAELLTRFFELVDRAPSTAFAVLTLKVAALNLLPIPALNGFEILLALAMWPLGRRHLELPEWLGYSVIFMLVIGIGWCIAFFSVLRHAL